MLGATQQEIADAAGISRECLTQWEGSSDAVPRALVPALGRVVSVFEARGIRFRPDGVFIERGVPLGSVLHSEAHA